MNRHSDMKVELSEEVLAVSAWLAENDALVFDPTLMDAAKGRALVIKENARWNVDLPELLHRGEVRVPADSALGSADVRCLVIVPPGPVHGTIIYVHGGGFAFFTPETHLRCAAVLGHAAGMAVVLPDYRLAPESPYPAGLKDVVAVTRLLLAEPGFFGLSAGPVILSGDSAGANLSLAALLHEQGRAGPQAAGGLLFYGTYGTDFGTQSYRVFHEGPGLTTPKMQRYFDWYAPGRVREDPLVAPLLASDEALRALPPLYLTAAAVDPLLSDTLILADRLAALGRRDPLVVEPGVMHGYLQWTVKLEAARRTLAEAGQAARRMAM